MTEYDNTNSGALFKNTRKDSERHPDYQGSINVEGHDYWISAWLKTSKAGDKFMSLSVKRKDGTADRPAQDKPKSSGFARDLDDDVPFAPEFR